MPAQSTLVPKSINPDIQKEREGASFQIKEFQEWWNGGAEKLKEKHEIEQYLYKDSEGGYIHDYLSHKDLYDHAVKQVTEASTKLRQLQKQRNPGGTDIWPTLLYDKITSGLLPANYPFATHITMFVDAIKGQGTPEQIEIFGKPAENCNIIGTYAQTELSHGSNVRGILTRADYDRKTDEFVLNTPSFEAYKWWPGGMGHTSNYAVVVAQLYIDGQHKGIQLFIVPIRDSETHMPLPGVDVGEIGRKIGMQGVNQGFLGLKNVRIPRTNMLMKNAKVMRDGSFIQSPDLKLNYMTMVYMRCMIVNLNSFLHLAAATIATRYSAVRRQSPINPNEREPQIMDHVTQQLKLFPEIATGIAYELAGQYMWKMYDQTLQDIEKGDYSRMQEMHILSSVLKVLCTTDSCAGIESLRLACGGHGYLSAANFGNIYGNAVAAYTYEGENTVLLLQVGRFLLKAWHDLTNGKKLLPSVAYFEEFKNMREFPRWNGTWECMLQALKYATANKTRTAFENMSRRVAAGHTQAEAANKTGIEITQAAELHGRQFVAATFYEQISKPNRRSSSLNNVLRNLLELYLLHTVLKQMKDIVQFVPLTAPDISALQQRLEEALQKIRPDAVAICDGFDYHDRVLNSVLGSYDGNVYERIFEAAKKSPMNQQPVQNSFEKHLKPFLKSNL